MKRNKSENPVSSKKRVGRRPKVVEHPLASNVEFTNREIGWLNFNMRVLHQAMDLSIPLLERVRFLSIVNSNLDEFFMKRVGGFKRQVAYGITAKSSDGKTPHQQLKDIRTFALKMIKEQGKVFSQILKPALKKEKIYLLKWSELTAGEKEIAQEYYLKNVFPVLTPLSVDMGHPFPFISNLSTSLAITLKHPNSAEEDEPLFARVKVPQVLPQWIRLNVTNENQSKYLSLVELIKENLHNLFPNMKVLKVMPFRITRNADLWRDEEDAEDLLSLIEEEIRARRFAEVVRLEHGPNPDPWMLKFLMEELEITEEDIYELPEELDLDYRGLEVIANLNISKLHFEVFNPVVPTSFGDENPQHIFEFVSQKDYLFHHPYESFVATVEKFIQSASLDPNVVAIKMTLYRTGDNSQFIKSLIRAAEGGKQVVCLVELKARFDEERNIYWAQELENAGVHVVYGVLGLKTHAKTALVVRKENSELKCYAHIGTGNYNSSTSKLYTDLGLLTCHEGITAELVQFFHYLTGRSLKVDYQHLLIAPVNMFSRFKFLIERELENAKQKLPSQIIVKMNNMEENDISMLLYKASSGGVDVNMIVRGFCCLRPQVKGLSENIKVISVIGRFLEHSRLFYFRNGQKDPMDGDFFIGSADWMYRNLHARVECIVPIYDRSLKEKIWKLLQMHIHDKTQTWVMDSNGNYSLKKSDEISLHDKLIKYYKDQVGSEQ